MFYFLDEIARQFRLFEVRDNRSFRREVFRAATLRAVDAGVVDLKGLLSELKLLAHYSSMGSNDRASYRQWETWLRKIVRGWHLLGSAEQRAFRDGDTQASTTAQLISTIEKERRGGAALAA